MLIWNPWKEIKLLREQLDASSSRYIKMMDDRDRLLKEVHRLLDRADKLHVGLRDVIAEEKPSSNATVKRMARIAREALKK